MGNEQYGRKDSEFRLNRTGSLRVTRLYLYKQYVNLRLADLQYLLKLFHVVQNQPNVYTLSLPHVLPYVIVALISTTYVETTPNASKHIMYPQVFEELKTIL